MDIHGDRGALDLNTVKNFTHQLLNVGLLVLLSHLALLLPLEDDLSPWERLAAAAQHGV
jgi:hypothetical protein